MVIINLEWDWQCSP